MQIDRYSAADVLITGRPLADCPFCGSGYVGLYHVDVEPARLYFVSCDDCDAEGPPDVRQDQARWRWNRRM